MSADAYRPYVPQRPPVQCVKCRGIHVILNKALHPQLMQDQWRFTCLDCRVAWPQEQHGGEPDEYA
ncbi:hypothetical protein J7W19_12645 [Streptomyces mobaraensis NBRC 13819 = DSM 40847]|uniref:Uncharacterized protein n=1 Tax=Streptomyces mobaraensis (strain ATCC 29032 / DSM 40847 / JCM 4168 / NBRC 13819 / NCIMB 11159 / IPCR 16-22) TaxID=1223523 RepID=M3AY56_STRM1|nr:hypothetical protein [Streptomyces mobaraensis]EME98577.1 hypothetical protein H340_20794 [Streptomyces mobaraensis NBRC 13819 = DSM 40847]QTT74146.1 hypothetical protein J7W19_12645 [Streptomyces mobaraensis NBRC 13819 = DSM 40847]